MISHEGDRNDVYPDHLGLPTVGIGHRVTKGDRLRPGDRISDDRKEQLWHADSRKYASAARQQMVEAGLTDPDFFLALADVNFQLGDRWKDDHKKTWKLIVEGDYFQAAEEVRDSDWYKQDPKRVNNFRRALLHLGRERKAK